MNTSLPNDQDRELAARIGSEGGISEAGQGPVSDALRGMQYDYRSERAADPRVSARLWAGIERSTRAGANRPGLRKVAPMRLIWGAVSVAAAVAVLMIVPRVLEPASGQVVAQAEAEIVVHTTEDGSRVTLRPYSRLFRTGESAFRLEGEAQFEVVSNPDRVFSVSSPAGQVEVLGTRFVVAALESVTRVYLEEGSVRFRFASDELVTLVPGQRLTARNGGSALPLEVGGEEDTDWLRGELVFESRPAGDVAFELARHYGLNIELPEGVREDSLTGRLTLSGQDQALADLGLVLGGRFVSSGSGFRFISQ